MKIKVIDLLNMISKGEEVPKKIKYNNETFTIREEKDDYANQNYWFTDRFCLLDLNEEVEIIDEAKEDKIQKIYHCETSLIKNEVEIFITENLNQMVDKINELIDVVNELKRDK